MSRKPLFDALAAQLIRRLWLEGFSPRQIAAEVARQRLAIDVDDIAMTSGHGLPRRARRCPCCGNRLGAGPSSIGAARRWYAGLRNMVAARLRRELAGSPIDDR